MPTLPDESLAEAPPVEFIERGPFDITDSVTVEEPMQRGPVAGTKALLAVSIGSIVLAFAVMTRPGPEDRVVEEPPQTTVAPSTTAAPVETDAGPPPPRPIPDFEPNLPDTLPGVISGLDARTGSLVVIDRSRSGPDEVELALVPETDIPTTRLNIAGGATVGLTADVFTRGDLLVADDDDAVIGESFNLGRIVPDRDGGVLIVDYEQRQIAARWTALGPADGRPGELTWTLPSPATEIAGVWGDELLVHRANRVWLQATDGETRSVGEGRFLAYDGNHLVRLVCDRVGTCNLALGTPDDPDQRTLPLPEWLDRSPDELWAPTVAIAPDGTRIALAGPNGGISSPLIVDFETGVSTPLADGINRQAAMSWSPDGRWLAYVYTDDVMVWSLDEGRSWRVTLDRELHNLLWR